jgi:hypothetical protein
LRSSQPKNLIRGIHLDFQIQRKGAGGVIELRLWL